MLAALGAEAQPANNNFANAIPLTGQFVTATGSNVGATRETGEPNNAGVSGGASVWWTWTPSDSGLITIDTFGSSFDTTLGVYTGNTVSQLTTIASDDDYFDSTTSSAQSQVQFGAIAGTVYRISVDGYSSSRGSIALHIRGPNGVSIASPTNGAVVTFGDPIPFTARISTNFPSPPAIRVDFYGPYGLFASSTNAPFIGVNTNAPTGTNSFYIVAVNSLSQSFTSAPISLFVQSIGVTLLTPVDGSYWDFGNTNPIPATAWAYLPPGLGTITNVEFFVDGQKFGQDSTAPYGASWNTVVGGSHRLTAVGKSDLGVSYTSPPNYIGVYKDFVPVGAIWKYLDNGSNQGTNWISPNFDDRTWGSGPSPLGYSDSNGRFPATTNGYGLDPNNKFITTYYRDTFLVTNLAGYPSMYAYVQRDDGVVLYLNGVEVFRNNMPSGTITYTTPASSNASDDGSSTYLAILNQPPLVEGTNVFAAEVHQNVGNSTDLWFQLQMFGIPNIIRNLAPSVAIISPTNNASFLAPASLTIQAAASDPDGQVAKVEFYADGVKLGETNSSPYSFTWNNPPIGAHVLAAVAFDDQGAGAVSSFVSIVVYDAVGTPVVRITSPLDGAIMEGPTNLTLTAAANAINGITNVEFLANGLVVGDASTSPYSVVWPSTFLSNGLTAIAFDANGVRGTSAVVSVTITIPPTNTVAPFILTQVPLAGSILTNLTNLVVTFSERVHHVDAGDLLVSGVPASGVSGSGSNYVFTFPQPPYGEVQITWASGHGITDFGYPADLPFNELRADAQWEYNLLDRTPPTIASRSPAAGSTVTNLAQISVTFSEPVTGVDAADLLVNGTPASGFSGSGSTYTFNVSQPPSGTISVTWAAGHGILDQADVPNAFNGAGAGAAWSFTLDARTVLVQSNSVWRFIKGTAEASSPSDAWRQPGFGDSIWSNSPAPYFFGDPYTNFPAGIYGTLLSDMRSNYSSIFLRQQFNVQNAGAITNLLLNAQSDDGFIAWINGVEVRRYNVPAGDLPYNATASSTVSESGSGGATYILSTLPNAASALVSGANVLAVQAFNVSATDADFGFNAQLYTYLTDISTVAPRVVQAAPTQGDVFYLTNLTVTFSEGVSNVDAADLLINGVPASGLSSSTNTTYTFSFLQPPYGPVVVTWDPSHGIADFDLPPKPFDATAASATFHYTLNNPSSPRIVTQTPLAGTTITGLTSITITFTKPVTGVDASDLLVNGAPATAFVTDDSITYTFAFTPPPFGAVPIRWASSHGITDLEVPPNGFDPTRFGGQWNYTLIDPVPSVAITSPTNGTFILAPATVTLGAVASDKDGTIARVDFLANGVNVGGASNAPYNFTWSNVPQGAYALRAVATDNSGLMGTSAPVVLNVVTSLPVVLVRGPYLQMGSPTGGVVRWRSDLSSDAVVFYGTDPNNLASYGVQPGLATEHVVTISGLQPDTKYFYSIGSSSQRLAGGTNFVDGTNYWFKTSPLAGSRRPFRFWVLGDSGTATANAVNVREAYYRLAATNGPADFWLMLGDNAYNSGTDAEYQTAVFNFYPTTLRNLFLWPTIGNHESNQSFTSEDYPYLNIFSLPHNGEAGGLPSGTQKYYSFDYANIHFICLDSMTSGRTTNTAMAQWLVNDLAATTQQWLIAFFHHPPYTKGNHNSDNETELIEIRQNILPILEANGVDLVMCGHSHAVERSYLLYGHYGFSSEMSSNPALKIDGGSGRADGTGAYRKNALGQGTVYSVSGSSGQITGGLLNDPAHFVELNELGSLVIDVNGGRLDVKCLGISGNSLDYYTLVKEPLPAAPASLIARAIDGNNVALTWTDLATNELGYILERSTDGASFVRFATNGVSTTNGLDSGLLANTTYFYRVRSYNLGGESNPTLVAGVTTVTAGSVPQAPLGLTASAGSGTQAYRSQIVLRWRDLSANEAGFLIERSADGSAFLPITSVGANATVYVDRNLASANTYYYRVRSFNPAGDSPPSNLDGDQTHPQTELVGAGESAIFHGGIEGTPPIRYQWRFNGSAISGATNESLTIANAQATNEGPYSVVVTDATGATTSNPAWLFVSAPPVIVQQPANRTNVLGSTATFNVVASGNSPLFYQWRKNGTNLTGAAADQLTIGPVTMADQGNYDVLVVNNLGAVTSMVARLMANTAPVALPDHLSGFAYQSIPVSTAALLANDSDPDGDALSITGVSAASSGGGTVTLTGQSILYSALPSFSGDDTFTYTLTDARGASVPGQVTVSISANRPPVFPVMSNLFASVRTLLVSSNMAFDPDVPTNTLAYSLDAGAPTNAHLNPSNGVFYWAPTRDQAPSTNPITLRVSDDGLPPLSNALSFIIYVNDYIEMTAGSALLSAGESNSVPIDVFSSADLTGLQCAIQFAGDRLASLAVDALVPQLGTLDLQMPDSNTAVLTFTAANGQSLQGTQHLAMLRFTAVAGQTSAFVPLRISSLTGTRSSPGLPPSLLVNDGRVAVVGAQPMLETLAPAGGVRQLMLYGKKNTTYTIQYSTNFGATWFNRGTGKTPTTNLSIALPVGNTPAPPVMYRARQ